MAWSTPPTFADGVALTAAQLNSLVADLNETAAAKATASGSYFAGTGSNSLAERTHRMAFDNTSDTTTGTGSYGDLAATSGPAVSSLTTGAAAMSFISASISNSTVGAISDMGLDVSGATSSSATAAAALRAQSASAGAAVEASYAMYYTLTPGSNTFTLRYRVSAGTGTFSARRLIVMPF